MLAVVLAAVLEWTHPTREACGTGCSTTYCAAWTAAGACSVTAFCPTFDSNDLWSVRLYVTPRWSTTWTLVRERRIAPNMAGQMDTLAVPQGWCEEHTATLALGDSSGNWNWSPQKQCAGWPFVSLYQCAPEGRVDVPLPAPTAPVVGQLQTLIASRFYKPYPSATLYDLWGRVVKEADRLGLFFERSNDGKWWRKVVIVR